MSIFERTKQSARFGLLIAAGVFAQKGLAQDAGFCDDVAQLVRSGQTGFRTLSSSGVNEDGYLNSTLPGARECALSEDNAALFCDWESDADNVEADAQGLLDGLAACLSSSIDLWPTAGSLLRGGIPGSRDEVSASVDTDGLLVKLTFKVISNSFDEIVGPPGTSQREMETRLAERERYFSHRPVINGYRVVRLGSLKEIQNPLDINDHGEVVGSFRNSDEFPVAFYWSPKTGQMQALGTLGGNMSIASGINNRGDVVGYAESKDSATIFAWWPGSEGLRQIAGLREQIEVEWRSEIVINEAGEIAGQLRNKETELFFWSPTEPTTIKYLGVDKHFNPFKRFDISNDGQVVFTRFSGRDRAMLWSARTGTSKDLGVINDSDLMNSAGLSISPNGRYVVGAAGYGAFIWSEATGMKRLPRNVAYAVGVNDHGDVIGNDHLDSGEGKFRALVWLARNNHEVQFLEVDGKTEGTVARAINNAGQIVGTFNDKAVLWDPIVEQSPGR